MSRPTPFDHVFAEVKDSQFPAIRTEAKETRRDTADRAQFARLSAVQRLLGEVETSELIERQPAAAAEYLSLLHVAYRFWAAGEHVIPVERDAFDVALRSPTSEGLPPVPHGACYFQLPERWFWAQVSEEEPHEPADGLFAAVAPRQRELTLVLVLGLRPDRTGFSQISIVTTPDEVLAARGEMRQPPFAPVVDGGDRAGVRSLVTMAELLALTDLALRAVEV